jgi:hypothetical protein
MRGNMCVARRRSGVSPAVGRDEALQVGAGAVTLALRKMKFLSPALLEAEHLAGGILCRASRSQTSWRSFIDRGWSFCRGSNKPLTGKEDSRFVLIMRVTIRE